MCNCFMKLSLTKSIILAGQYMNHCIRTTVISTLDYDGFEARHIIQLSSHKSESAVKEYSTKCHENKRKEMFQSLTNAISPQAKKLKKSATVSHLKSTNETSTENALVDINDVNTTF